MVAVNLKNMDVDALLVLRADVEKLLVEKGRDLQRQIALLEGSGRAASGKRLGRPPGGAGRTSAMKGVKVPPKYRGPGGETWAGRGVTPRWLKALIDEGHSIEEFLIGQRGGKRVAAGAKTAKRMVTKKAAKPVRKPRRPKESKTKAESAAA